MQAASIIKAEVVSEAKKVKNFPIMHYYPINMSLPGLVLYTKKSDPQLDHSVGIIIVITPKGILSLEEKWCAGSLLPHYQAAEHFQDYLIYGNQALKLINRLLEQQEHNS